MLASELLLSGLPKGLREPLLSTYSLIASNFVERRWEPSELNGGKFCEVVYCILEGAISGNFATHPTKPTNMRESCLALERLPADSNRAGDRSLRILIPRMLISLYEIRNNRGVGHVGGDVSPNNLDATAVYSISNWIIAELVRIFHSVPTKVAQSAVDAIVQRKIPLIWEDEEIKRVLDPGVSTQDQVLLLLHQTVGWVDLEKLVGWVEYKAKSMFAVRVLIPLHERRLIEFDSKSRRAKISPTGVKRVEDEFLRYSR